MECDSEYRRLANRNPFILSLEEQGYDVNFLGSHLVIRGLPYLDDTGELLYGDLASPLDLLGEYEIGPPKSHQVWFRGKVPCDVSGAPLKISAVQNSVEVVQDLICNIAFSLKIGGRDYLSFEEKITTYLNILVAPAKAKFDAVPQKYVREMAESKETPLRYPDTMSARDGINDLARRFAGMRVGIIGAGGTGGYILDFIAKTRVELIRVYDDDVIHVHTIFRWPGAVGRHALGRPKVHVLEEIYSDFHSGIEAIEAKVTAENVGQLSDLNFVFIAVDNAPSRQVIAESLVAMGIPFVDVGMGLYRAGEPLDGMIRMAGGHETDGPALMGTEYLPGKDVVDNEYRRQPQLGELNALNAALAVIRFKQYAGFYHRALDSRGNIFELSTFDLDHIVL